MKKALWAFCALGATVALSSCNSKPEWEDEWVAQDIVAARAAKDQIKIDGIVSKGEWDDAQAYQLSRAKDWGYDALLPRQRAKEDRTTFERGFFKVKYDDEFLYVLASLDDADLVQTMREGTSQGNGDAVEVFLTPEKASAIWEFYGTPWGNVSTIFYPWRGHVREAQEKPDEGVKAAAAIRGTLNSGDDKDGGWDIEIAIPRKTLEKTGEAFEPGKEWRILFGRRNFGKDFPSPQISSTPRLPRPDHLLKDYYSKLKFKE